MIIGLTPEAEGKTDWTTTVVSVRVEGEKGLEAYSVGDVETLRVPDTTARVDDGGGGLDAHLTTAQTKKGQRGRGE